MRHRSGPRAGRKYPRKKVWLAQRDACYKRAGDYCEVSDAELWKVRHGEDCTDGQCETFDDGYCRVVWRRACDHIFPERWVRRHCPGADPHILENLVAVTPEIHARKTAIEWKIFKADYLGYRAELVRIGYSKEMLERALGALLYSVKAKNERMARNETQT